MKKIVLFFAFILYVAFSKVQAQTNINFEFAHFQNWQGAYNNTTCGTSTPNPMTAGGIDTLSSPPQHTIVSTGFDPSVTLAQLPVNSPWGGNFSARLGDTIDGCRAAELTQIVNINSSNSLFSFSYAFVVNDNGTHLFGDAPKFIYRITDVSGNCFVTASCDTIVYSAADTSFHHGSNNPNGIYYTKWRQLCFDLSPYMGLAVRIEFTTSDCDAGSHRGYAYVDCQFGTCGILGANSADNLSGSVSVYPNPANNYINLTFKSLQYDEFEITLRDIQGNTILKDNFASALGQINKIYKTENLPRGIYFVYIKTKQQGTIQKKIIIN